LSYDEKYNLAQSNYDSGNWFDAILYLSDFPDNYLKNSVIDLMMQNSLNSYFDEKWSYISSLGLTGTSSGQLLVYLSDFPKNYKTAEITDKRKNIVDNVLDGRIQAVKDMIKDKSFTEALEYMDKNIMRINKDVYSGEEYEYSNYNDTKPLRNTVYYEIGKRSIEGGNYQRAIDMLSQVTQDFPNYSDAQSLLSRAKSQQK
jgi:tetratricopeptide (TPR) repeat protein